MTELTISKIDADDFIVEHKVPVISGGSRKYGKLPFGWKKRKRDALREKATELLQPVLDRKKELELTDTLSKGEERIVSATITSKFESIRNTLTKSAHTCDLLLQTFDGSPDSNDAMLRMYEELDQISSIWNRSRIHELIVFNDSCEGIREYELGRLLDDIRMSHPMFAYEDLSDLNPEELALAKKLLRAAFTNYEAGYERTRNKNEEEKVKFSSPLGEARRKIFNHTPHMTPALANVFIEHPERADEVMQMLADRDVPVHRADSMIEAALSSPVPLSNGAL